MINTAASAADTEIREFCETLFEGIRVDHAVRQAKTHKLEACGADYRHQQTEQYEQFAMTRTIHHGHQKGS